MAKLIYAINSTKFEEKYENQWNQPTFRVIAFTSDGYLYTHGKKFAISLIGKDISDVNLTYDNGKLIFKNKGYSDQEIQLPIYELKNNEQGDAINVSNNSGIWTISHKNDYTEQNVTSSIIDNLLNIPTLNIDKFGHVSGITENKIDVYKINYKQVSTKINLSGNKNGAGIDYAYYNPNIYIESDTLTAPKINFGQELLYNNVKVSDKLFETNGNLKPATDKTLGFVKVITDLSNFTSSDNTIVPSAQSVKNYTDGIIAASDAMVFKGVINQKTIFPPTEFKVGDTYKVAEAGTYAGQKCEVGDIIICVSTTSIDNWAVIQSNIDGALFSKNGLKGIVYGNGKQELFATTPTTANTYLTYNGTGYEWKDITDNNTWRPILINGSQFLDDGVSKSFDLKSGDTINLTTNSKDNSVKIDTNLKTLNIGSLEYNGSKDITLSIGNGLSISGTTLGHSNKITALSEFKPLLIKYDAYGHIAGTSKFGKLTINNTTSYDGSGDVNITGLLTSHDYKTLNFYNNNKTESILSNSDKTLNIKAGSNVSFVKDELSNLIINSTDTNTWRSIQAYQLNSEKITQILSNSIGTAALSFGDDFVWSDNELNIVWTEIDESGNITYVS